jgi:hypothetical protein
VTCLRKASGPVCSQEKAGLLPPEHRSRTGRVAGHFRDLAAVAHHTVLEVVRIVQAVGLGELRTVLGVGMENQPATDHTLGCSLDCSLDSWAAVVLGCRVAGRKVAEEVGILHADEAGKASLKYGVSLDTKAFSWVEHANVATA